MAYDDETPSSEPTLIMPAVPGDGAPPPPLPPSPPGPGFPSNGGPNGPNPNRTPMIIAGAGAALLVLFAVIFALTRDSDDEVTTNDSTLPLTIASSSLPATTLPATTLPATTAPPTTLPATTAPATTAATTTTLPPTTTVASTTTVAPTTTAPTTTIAPTTTVATTVPIPMCASDDLSIRIGDREVTAADTFTEVYLTNSGGSTCILDAPGIMHFFVDDVPVAAPLTATSTTDLQLSAVGAASALWRMSTVESLGCTPSDATTIELVFGSATVSVPASDPVCADPSIEQGELQGFEAGIRDLVTPPG